MIKSWTFHISYSMSAIIIAVLLASCSPAEEHGSNSNSLYFQHHKEFHTITKGLGKNGRRERDKPGEAVGVFDVNRDGLDDIVILNSTQSYFVLLNSKTANGRHEFNMTSYRVAEVRDDKLRVAKTLGLHDFNDDGYLDLHLGTMGKGTERTAWRPRKAGLKRSGDYCTQINQGDGTFIYQDLGVNGVGSKRAIVFADFDGDSRFDAYINTSPYYGPWYQGSPAPAQLYSGIGSEGKFGPDMLDKMLINAPEDFWNDKEGNGKINFKGAVVRDFDNDGKPDLISGAIADIRGDPFGNKVTPADGPAYQGDWNRGIFVFRNVSQSGKIQFEDVSNTAIENAYGRTDQMHVSTIFPADLNNDKRLDLVVVGPREEMMKGSIEHKTDMIRVYRNDSSPGEIKFTNITQQSGLNFYNVSKQDGSHPHQAAPDSRLSFDSIPYNAVVLDIDNDADNDIVLLEVGLGKVTPLKVSQAPGWIFINDGEANFSSVGTELTGLKAGAKHLSLGDFNEDGKQDIIATKPDHLASTKGENRVYFNANKNTNSYIKVDVSAKINKLGIGTKVTVFESGTERLIGYDEVRTDFGYRSKKSTTLHFGLGTVEKVDVVLDGRDGRSSVHRNLTVNTRHNLNFP